MAQLESNKPLNLRIIGLGLIIFIAFTSFIDLSPGNPQVTYTAAIAIIMALWWVTEAIPIGVTALLPVLLFPAFGIMNGKAVSTVYINYIIFLFLGGFMMAIALEKWNLHKRMALAILMSVGGSPFRILLGFMLASAFLSMWMSNTATAMMMLPIAFSVLNSLEEEHGKEDMNRFSIGILLSIAYACSIGGIATLVGTPPNLAFVRIFEITFPNATEISFGQWLIFALPLAIGMFFITLVYLAFLFIPKKPIKKLNRSFFKEKYKALGPLTYEQKVLSALFILLILLWIFRKNINIGATVIPGWSQLLNYPKFINDGTIAIFIALLLFIIPSKENKGEGLITWNVSYKIPWHIILLFGGGFALAKGFLDSGLSAHIGAQLQSAGNFSDLGLIATITTVMSFLTEFTSNTATTEMMLPIISAMATQIGTHPILLMVPLTLAASMAFMFPIATPPNAIVFGSGKIKMKDMIFTGFFLNMLAIILITLTTYYWLPIAFDMDLSIFPEWAKEAVLNHSK
ncbi:protein I'm not dead yet [Flavobacteriaceae bacterium UJ101]|nr:protein I'm not dead yet [Flavobacteriaceae bacterium UJ101]